MNREQIVRDTAYAIWEAEGRPEGREAEHWQRAEQQVAGGETGKPEAKSASKAVKPETAPAKTPRAPARRKSS